MEHQCEALKSVDMKITTIGVGWVLCRIAYCKRWDESQLVSRGVVYEITDEISTPFQLLENPSCPACGGALLSGECEGDNNG